MRATGLSVSFEQVLGSAFMELLLLDLLKEMGWTEFIFLNLVHSSCLLSLMYRSCTWLLLPIDNFGRD